ncbi:MAG: hypothetical protein AAF447_19640, partial [Myxococcota bacterium]
VAEAAGIRFVTTSGASYYGDTGPTPVTEATEVPELGPFGPAARAETELAATRGGIVIRPGIVYGRSGSKPMVYSLGGVRQRGRAGYVNDAHAISTVHVDDLADLYVLALTADAPPATLLGASGTVAMKDVMVAASDGMGLAQPPEAIDADTARNSFAVLGHYASMDMRLDASLTRERLGWSPTRPALVEELRSGSYAATSTETVGREGTA